MVGGRLLPPVDRCPKWLVAGSSWRWNPEQSSWFHLILIQKRAWLRYVMVGWFMGGVLGWISRVFITTGGIRAQPEERTYIRKGYAALGLSHPSDFAADIHISISLPEGTTRVWEEKPLNKRDQIAPIVNGPLTDRSVFNRCRIEQCADFNDVRYYPVPSLQDLFKTVKPEVILDFLTAPSGCAPAAPGLS